MKGDFLYYAGAPVKHAKIEATGYQPQVSLDAGIAELIKVYTILRVKGYANA